MSSGKEERPEEGSTDDLVSLLAVIFSWLLLFPAILLIVVAAGGKFWSWAPIVQFAVVLLIITCVVVFVLHRDDNKQTEKVLGALFALPENGSNATSAGQTHKKLGDVVFEYFSSLGVVAILLNLVAYSFHCYSFPLQGFLLALASLVIFLVYVVALLRFGAALRGVRNQVAIPLVCVSMLLTAFLLVFSIASGSSARCS